MTAADFPFDLRTIEHAARSIRSFGVELDDLVSETACVLLARARSRPDEARRYPTRMARWAAQDALRRLTRSRRAERPALVSIGEWDPAAPPPEREDEDEQTEAQLAEWRALPTGERIRRVAEAEAALGSSPTAGGAPVRTPTGGLASYGWTAARRAARADLPPLPRTCERCRVEIPRTVPAQARFCGRRCQRSARDARRGRRC